MCPLRDRRVRRTRGGGPPYPRGVVTSHKSSDVWLTECLGSITAVLVGEAPVVVSTSRLGHRAVSDSFRRTTISVPYLRTPRQCMEGFPSFFGEQVSGVSTETSVLVFRRKTGPVTKEPFTGRRPWRARFPSSTVQTV